jgi:hypothetical protein
MPPVDPARIRLSVRGHCRDGFVHFTAVVAAAILALLLCTTSALAATKGTSKRDATPPTVTFAWSSYAATAGTTLVVSGSASDNVGVAGVAVSVDGGSYQTAQGTTSWSYSLNTSGLAAGGHTLSARATDTSGNTATSAATLSVAADTTAPSVTITAPVSGSTVSGQFTVAGSASDNVRVSQVAVSVDGGSYTAVAGTTSWSTQLSATALTAGTHSVTARATDSSGNQATTSVTVTVADTTPPVIAISAPTSGSTVSGTITVAGSASDNAGVAKVELAVDGSYSAAQGTTAWTASLDTTALSNGSHTLTARATDTSGNTATTSVTVTASNGLPAGIAQKMVTPEGATIEIATGVSGWTTQQVYDLLKPNAYELSLLGPMLTVEVQTQYSTDTSIGVSQVNGTYQNYHAIIYLQATSSSVFTAAPDYAIAHEYGHAWATYHLYMTQNGDWSSYLNFRGIAGDPRLGSSLSWDPSEMIADDYRMLFGTSAAVSEMSYINPDVPDPRTVTGLHDFLAYTWA